MFRSTSRWLLLAVLTLACPANALAQPGDGPAAPDDHPFQREIARTMATKNKHYRAPSDSDSPYMDRELDPLDSPGTERKPHKQGYAGHRLGVHPQGNLLGRVAAGGGGNFNDHPVLGVRFTAGAIAPIAPAPSWSRLLNLGAENSMTGSGAMADPADQEDFVGSPEGDAKLRGLPGQSPTAHVGFPFDRSSPPTNQGMFPANRSGGLKRPNRFSSKRAQSAPSPQ